MSNLRRSCYGPANAAFLPVVLVEGLLRLLGAGVWLSESVFFFSSDDTGTFTPHQPWFVKHGDAAKSPARFRILLGPSCVWINAACRRGDIGLCAG